MKDYNQLTVFIEWDQDWVPLSLHSYDQLLQSFHLHYTHNDDATQAWNYDWNPMQKWKFLIKILTNPAIFLSKEILGIESSVM